jgi:hypothetical protein
MGRTKEATVLVNKVGKIHGFEKIANNDFVFGNNKIVIRSAMPEIENGYKKYFFGVTHSKLLENKPDETFLILVLGDEKKIIYLPGEKALELLETAPLLENDQVKFVVWERYSYFAFVVTGKSNIEISRYFNANPFLTGKCGQAYEHIPSGRIILKTF